LEIGLAVRFEIGEPGGSGLPKPYEMGAPNGTVRWRELQCTLNPPADNGALC